MLSTHRNFSAVRPNNSLTNYLYASYDLSVCILYFIFINNSRVIVI